MLNNKIKDWKNRSVIVLGASSGIGFELSHLLLSKGAFVILCGRSEQNLKKIHTKYPKKSMIQVLDVTKFTDIKNLFKHSLQKTDKIDLIFYLAADYNPETVLKINSEHAKKIFDVNLMGLYRIIEVFLPYYLNRGSGGFAIFSSVAGYRGLPKCSIYGASKSALTYLAETLYIELKSKNIDVYLVNPGFVETRLTDKNDFFMPFIITPNDAAKKTLSGISKGKFEITYPKRFTYIMKTLKFLPNYFYLKILQKFT